MNLLPSTLLKSYFDRLMDGSYSFNYLKIINEKERGLCTALKRYNFLSNFLGAVHFLLREHSKKEQVNC